MKHLLAQLADFVEARIDWIIDRWLRAVDRRPDRDSAANLTIQQLVDHLPELCKDLAERLRHAGQSHAASENHHAHVHATHRWEQGYRLDELIREAGVVRRIVTIDLLQAFAAETANFDAAAEMEARRIIEHFFNDVLVESAEQFSEEKEAALRASQQHSQAILDSALDCVIVMGQDGLIREWNPASERVFGFKRQEVLGKELAALIIPPQLRERHRRGLARFLATGDGPLLGHRVEINAIRADGSSLLVELSIAAYLLEGSWVFTAYLRDITARKADEEASQRLAALVRSSADAIIATNPENIITSWNEGAQRLYGYTAEEVIGKPITVIVPPEYYNQEIDILRRVARGELIARFQTVRLCKDGRLLDVSLTASPIRDKDNNVLGASKIARDITEPKRAERAAQLLLAVNEDLSRLFSPEEMMRAASARVGEFFGASRCAVLELNHQAETFSVLSEWRRDSAARERAGTQRMAEYMAPELRAALASGAVIVVNNVNADPRTAPAAEKYSALDIAAYVSAPFISRGEAKAALALYRDAPYEWREAEINLLRELTARVWSRIERARYEEALRETSERFQTLADNIAPLAWMADPDGWIFFYNKRWFEYTGTTLEEMQGWGWEKVHHPDYIERVTAKWKDHLQRGEPWEDTFPLRSADGEYRWFLSRASPIRDREGKIVRWFGTNTDFDDQKRTEEALRLAQQEAEAANQAKDRFLAALSHELRTPLNPVLMWACAALEDDTLDPTVRDGLRMICRNIEMEARLIDDLLDLTRIARGKLQLRLQPCDAGALLQHSIEIVRSQTQTKDLRVSVTLSASNHIVEADPTRLQQVFWNLLKNGCKFAPVGGEISVRSYDSAPGVLALEFADNGPGIDPALMPRLFVAFEQGTRTGEGLGLGLAISKGIIEVLGGKLHARNKENGSGALFTVELNAVADGRIAQPHGAKDAASSLPQQLRILIVEDHADTATVMRKLLERAGHQVMVASTMRDAIALLHTVELDVLVSDLGLPDGNGMQIMRELTRISDAKGIAISGYGMEEDRNRSRAAGFSAHLTKPIDVHELTKTIRRVTEPAH
ncbi:MAG: PAS domain S-box protein [Verrucomicrobia bacterium]|nr:PAS domain S-box protein [Verrucomicrobiota bacterium]